MHDGIMRSYRSGLQYKTFFVQTGVSNLFTKKYTKNPKS